MVLPPAFVQELSTFVAVRKDHIDACMALNRAPLGYQSQGKKYTGLRETALDALERAKMYDKGQVTKHTYVMLNICFSPAGIAYYSAQENAGQAQNFAPVLSKTIYHNGSTDWKVWHFLTDLPLWLEAGDGTLLIHSEWKEIV